MFRKTILLLILGGLLIHSLPGNSQVLEPVEWEFEKEWLAEDELLLTAKASIEHNWYLYGLEIPEGGPVPTSFNINDSEHFELIGDVWEVTEPELKHDPFFDMDLPLFSIEAWFNQKVRILSDKEFKITGFIEYMSCDDERCLPPQERPFEYVINPGSPASASKDGAENENAPLPGGTSSGISVPAGTRTIDTSEFPIESPDYEKSLWLFFFIAFAGGLAGLLTPCVFPMIPMTVSFFIQKQSGRVNSIINALIFGISVIAIYTSLGLLVSLTSVGAGFANQLTSHWLPNIIFFLLFVAFAASFFGMFEITLPSSLATKADSKAESGGYLGSFFMALTLVIVSLSCVGPIVGALLVEAASGGSGSQPVIGMLGFSLAFAIPFTLLAIFPSWLNKLPKSGGWLNTVKVVLGFIVLAFSLQFLMVVDQSYHWGILTRDVFIAIWIVLFSLLGMYLLGKIKFAHDSDLPHIGVPRLFLAIAVFSFVLYLIPGMFGAPLKAISSMLPARHTHTFNIAAMLRDAEIQGENRHAQLCEEPKYSDFLHMPHGLQGYFDLKQGLECSREQNKPLLLSFSGHGCSNCKEMEARVWSDPRVLRRLREDYIIITLYVDDRTRLSEDEWVTSEYDGRVKNTIGRKNLDYQISNFNTNSQPYYVLKDGEGNLLSQPRGYNLNIESFIDFLDSGLENYGR